MGVFRPVETPGELGYTIVTRPAPGASGAVTPNISERVLPGHRLRVSNLAGLDVSINVGPGNIVSEMIAALRTQHGYIVPDKFEFWCRLPGRNPYRILDQPWTSLADDTLIVLYEESRFPPLPEPERDFPFGPKVVTRPGHRWSESKRHRSRRRERQERLEGRENDGGLEFEFPGGFARPQMGWIDEGEGMDVMIRLTEEQRQAFERLRFGHMHHFPGTILQVYEAMERNEEATSQCLDTMPGDIPEAVIEW
jgi:hypothetical protein